MISIVTPVLNGSKYIESNIQSIIKLTVPFEHIIVDGGSSDSTIDIINKYPHIKLLIQNKKTGMYGAIHQGFEVAKYEIITWINCDDTILPIPYSYFVKAASDGDADFYYSNSYITEYESNKTYKKFVRIFPIHLLREGLFPFVQPATLFRKKVYFKVGGLRYDLFKISGDRDLFQRMAYDRDIKFKYYPAFITSFLNRKDSLLFSNKDLALEEQQFMLKTNHSLLNRLINKLSNPIRRLEFSINRSFNLW